MQVFVVPILYCLPGVACAGVGSSRGRGKGAAGRQRQLSGSLNEGRQFIAEKTTTTSCKNYDAHLLLLLLLPAMTFVFV